MDASVHRDRNVKLPKYAESGIPEVWLVDIRGREIEVCRQPVGHQYLDRRIFVRGQTLAPEAFPDVVLNVQDIVG
jgi:Uma2 family endonuclease